MADNAQQLLREKWTSLLEKHWVTEQESVLWVEVPGQGYVGSVVNQRLTVPHAPMSDVQANAIDPPHWPLPSEHITSGGFLGDEWADDPSIIRWVVSTEAGRDAVLFGDHFAAASGEGFLALTTSRLAIVLKEKQLATAPREESKSGGLFGRAKAAVDQARRVAETFSPQSGNPVSYSEVSVERIADMSSDRMGASIPRSRMLRDRFRRQLDVVRPCHARRPVGRQVPQSPSTPTVVTVSTHRGTPDETRHIDLRGDDR